MSKSPKVWAIGMGSWVELRVTDSAPIAKVTECKLPDLEIVVYQQVIDALGNMRVRPTTQKTKRVIRQTIWEGGEVLCCVGVMRFYSVTQVLVQPGTLEPLNAVLSKNVLTAEWRMTHLGKP